MSEFTDGRQYQRQADAERIAALTAERDAALRHIEGYKVAHRIDGGLLIEAQAERDAARAAAAAWKRAAKWWRNQALNWGRESQIMSWWNEASRKRRHAAEAGEVRA